MALDLSSLRKAIDALQRSVDVASGDVGPMNADVLEAVKAGVIQNFEVAYEQCWKFIQRWLRENQGPEDADHPRTRKDLFRAAARYKLISDPLAWFAYADARNLTSHTYSEREASAVFAAAQRFLQDAKELLVRLESSND